MCALSSAFCVHIHVCVCVCVGVRIFVTANTVLSTCQYGACVPDDVSAPDALILHPTGVHTQLDAVTVMFVGQGPALVPHDLPFPLCFRRRRDQYASVDPPPLCRKCDVKS